MTGSGIMNSMMRILPLLICTAAFFIGCQHENQGLERPNIVFILADDHQAAAIGGLGHPDVLTPNLDMLLSEGTAFRNAYIMGSHNPAVCMPSRAMLLTGRHLGSLEQDGYAISGMDTMLGEWLGVHG
jgi:arylsulfatase A-like enzyme